MPSFEKQIAEYIDKHRAEIEEIVGTDGETEPILDLYAALEERLSELIIQICSENNNKIFAHVHEMKKANIEMAAILSLINEKCDDLSSNSSAV